MLKKKERKRAANKQTKKKTTHIKPTQSPIQSPIAQVQAHSQKPISHLVQAQLKGYICISLPFLRIFNHEYKNKTKKQKKNKKRRGRENENRAERGKVCFFRFWFT